MRAKTLIAFLLIGLTANVSLVPRSYMPLTGGTPHWGTGEYNVKVSFSEHCDIADGIRDNWKKDYRYLKKMKKKESIWPSFCEHCVQQGNSILKFTLETASSNAIHDWEWLNQ